MPKEVAQTYRENYEYIETEIPHPLANPLEGYSIELRMEMQEEIDFQNRLEKETQVILEIKKIAQAKLEYYLLMKKELQTVDEWMQVFMDNDAYMKCSRAQRKEMRDTMSFEWKTATELYESFLTRVLEKIEEKPVNLIEVLYLEIHGFDADRRSNGTVIYNKEQNILQITSSMIKILHPFLTKEFFYFFSKIQNAPSSRKEMNALSLKEMRVEDKINGRVDLDIVEDIYHLGKAIFKRAKKHKVLHNLEIREALEKILDEAQRICHIIGPRHKKMERELVAIRANKKETDYIDVTRLPYWKDMRENFSLAYNVIRQIQEMELFIDEWLAKQKIRTQPTVTQTSIRDKVECVEMVPALDDAFTVDAEVSDSEYEDDLDFESDSDTDEKLRAKELEAFREYKAQQLFLWRKVVKYRQQQRAEKEKLQKEQLEKGTVLDSGKDTIDIPRAQQLCDLYQNLDGQDIQLYDSLFISDASCKPHNVCFTAIEKLVRNIGGELKNDTGSSHFPIYLPDTHYIWSVNTQSQSMSYLAVPRATGGSYKPHNTSDEWTRSAHLLLKNAFVKAGITPERIALAQALIEPVRVKLN